MVRLLALAALAAGVACATGRAGSSGAPEHRAQRGWLFYSDSDGTRLVAVRPSAAVETVVLESGAGKISHPALVLSGHRDAATGRLTGVRAHAVVYLREGPAGILTVHTARAAGEDPPVSRRVSRLALPSGTVCGAQVVPDHARPEESLFAIDAVATAGTCGGDAEHRVAIVRLSMDESADPLQIRSTMVHHMYGAGAVLAALYSDAGAISRLLLLFAFDGGLLDGELRTFSAKAPGEAGELMSARAEEMLRVGWDRVWVVAGGKLRFHVGGGLGRDPGGVATPAAGKINAADGQYLYFVDGRAIRRVRLDGRSAAQTVHAAPDGAEVTSLAVSASRVLFRTTGTGGSWLWSVPKAGGAAARLSADPELDSGLLPSGRSLFVVRPDRVLALREDGADPVTLATGDFVVLTRDTGTFVGNRLGYAFVEESDEHEILLVEPEAGGAGLALGLRRVDPPTPSAERGAAGAGPGLRLRRVDPLTRSAAADLGTLPAGYAQPIVILRATSDGATLLFAQTPSGKSDVFLLETSPPGSVRQLTHTPDVDETPVGPRSCESGGWWTPTVAGLVLGARLRRRRR